MMPARGLPKVNIACAISSPVDTSTKIHLGRRVKNVAAGTIAATHDAKANETTTMTVVEIDPTSNVHVKLIKRHERICQLLRCILMSVAASRLRFRDGRR